MVKLVTVELMVSLWELSYSLSLKKVAHKIDHVDFALDHLSEVAVDYLGFPWCQM